MTNEKLNKEILADLNRLAVENKFSGLEKIKQIHLTLDPFTIENDILTPTMKIKRNIARKIFDKEIAEMYAKPIIGA
jgi:long-chain acyl-CoA synthetase